MPAEFETIAWDPQTAAAARRLIQMALEEDLAGQRDVTSCSVASAPGQGAARFVAREHGVVAGLQILPLVIEEATAELAVELLKQDGDFVRAGDQVASVSGNVVDLLSCERTMLNFLCRLSGTASLTRQFVDQTKGTGAQVYDTRKTTPGWRRLEKYAVHCGGGVNHRMGLHDAVLIKDNHLAHADQLGLSPAEAVAQARDRNSRGMVIEVEVDSLDQLRNVLPARPDIVLLDNMSPERLREAVGLRDQQAPEVVLEASGGVTLGAIRSIAESGVDRVSVGALTHSAGSLDFGLDWM